MPWLSAYLREYWPDILMVNLMLIDTNPVAISASLVLYKPDFVAVERTLQALECAAQTASEFYKLQLQLTLVDNSSDQNFDNSVSDWLENFRARVPSWSLQLILSKENLGYGRGNNLVIANARSTYHVVINPDLFVEENALLEAIRYMAQNPDVGLLTPAVFGEQGERHYMCKRNPTLLTMYLRSFSPLWLQSVLKSIVDSFEMRDCDYEKSIHPIEYPTGCFMFFRTGPLQAIGGFDPDFFLHYEDADIGRRMLQIARVVYVPQVRVVHQWARDTHRSLKAKLITVRSGLLYWRKWGGIFASRSSVGLPDVTHATAACGTQFAANPNRRILVTGAAGFIGQAVCSDLSARGYQVIGALRQQLDACASNVAQYAEMGDMHEATNWSDALVGVDSVVHLAARVHLMNDSAQDPLAEYRRVNVDMTMNLARQSATAGARRFVFISSVKVNGEYTPFGQPFTADDTPHPTDPYGVSKFEAEQMLSQLALETGMEVVIIRPVLVYGPGVKANFLNMMHWLQKGIPLPLEALENQRSLLAIDNLVDLIATCLHHPAAANQIFLASDGSDISIPDLLRRTGIALGKSVRFIPVPVMALRGGARLVGKTAVVQRLCDSLQVDISKTRRVLGWTPPVKVDDALLKTAQHFRRASN
jgi:nucleoside-diphosphate-sugar epimerase/GT2 family glycosyltransferase